MTHGQFAEKLRQHLENDGFDHVALSSFDRAASKTIVEAYEGQTEKPSTTPKKKRKPRRTKAEIAAGVEYAA